MSEKNEYRVDVSKTYTDVLGIGSLAHAVCGALESLFVCAAFTSPIWGTILLVRSC